MLPPVSSLPWPHLRPPPDRARRRRDGPKPNVEAAVTESSRWGQGYEGAFRLVNK